MSATAPPMYARFITDASARGPKEPMLKILLVKTSSLGDVIHTLPALTDAGRAMPGITFDWVVEESFAEIPLLHPNVRKVIPVAWRRWRKNMWTRQFWREMTEFWRSLCAEKYDLVIDAQGLVKSACVTRMARGVRAGLDWDSAREPLASLGYQKKCHVNFYQHAIVRMRSIFSALLEYPMPQGAPEYGVSREAFLENHAEDYIVFLHGTTWETKLWPESYWVELAKLAAQREFKIKLLWGNALERQRAERLAAQVDNIKVLPKQDLLGSAKVIANARGVVALDTGLTHLAAALEVPTVSLYGPTNPIYTGAEGKSQVRMAAQFPCAPCFKRECTYLGKASVSPACFSSLSAQKVWNSLLESL